RPAGPRARRPVGPDPAAAPPSAPSMRTAVSSRASRSVDSEVVGPAVTLARQGQCQHAVLILCLALLAVDLLGQRERAVGLARVALDVQVLAGLFAAFALDLGLHGDAVAIDHDVDVLLARARNLDRRTIA